MFGFCITLSLVCLTEAVVLVRIIRELYAALERAGKQERIAEKASWEATKWQTLFHNLRQRQELGVLNDMLESGRLAAWERWFKSGFQVVRPGERAE